MLCGRRLYWVIFSLSLFAILTSLYMQFVMSLVPCVLCVMQRVVVFGIFLVASIGLIQHPKHSGRYVYHALFVLLLALGFWFSGRQVWLQHLPPGEATACGPGLDYLIQALPPGELIGVLFTGSGNCAQIHWSLWGISIAGWAFCCFTVLMILVLCDVIQTRRRDAK